METQEQVEMLIKKMYLFSGMKIVFALLVSAKYVHVFSYFIMFLFWT